MRLGVQAGEGREQVSGGDDGNRHPLQRGKVRGDGEAGKDREARAQDQRLLVLQQILLVGVQGERDGEDHAHRAAHRAAHDATATALYGVGRAAFDLLESARRRAARALGARRPDELVITTGATGQGEMAGILVVLAAVVTWSVASVFMRQLTAKYPPILVTAYGMVISLIFHIPTGLAAAVQAGGTGLSSANILVVLYLGLVGSGLAQYTWTASLAELPASTCSLFYPLQPMFSALLGILLLNETFTPSFLVGLVLISADVILSTLETRKLAKQAQAGSDR